MEEKIINILENINEEILSYDGDNMIKDGLISSFEMIEIFTELEMEFNIKIDADYANAKCFSNKNTIIEMVKKIIYEK